MSRKLIGIIIAALLVLGGGTAYVLTQNKEDKKADTTKSSNSSNSKQAAEDPLDNGTYKGDLLSITEAGKARKCTFSSQIETVTTQGTLYTDGKGRGFMEIVIPNVGTTNALALSDKVYGWTSTGGSTTGLTYTKAELQQMAKKAADVDTTALKPFDMTCTSWKVEVAKFTVPTNINFMSVPAN